MVTGSEHDGLGGEMNSGLLLIFSAMAAAAALSGCALGGYRYADRFER